jgi:hypothetical protein
MTLSPIPATTEAVEALGAAAALAAAYGRDDLARRLMDRRGLLASPGVTVCVLGEYKQGKSSLINVLLGIPYLPVDDDLATAAPGLERLAHQALDHWRRLAASRLAERRLADAARVIARGCEVMLAALTRGAPVPTTGAG